MNNNISCKDCIHFYSTLANGKIQITKLMCSLHQTVELSKAQECGDYKNITCATCKYLQIDDDRVAICLWGKEVGMENYIIHDQEKDCCEMWEKKTNEQ